MRVKKTDIQPQPMEPADNSRYSPGQTQKVKAEAIRQALNGQMSLMIRAANRTDLSDLQAVEAVAEQYIGLCEGAGVLPSVEGLCCALGISRKWFYKYVSKNPDSDSARFLTQIRTAWAALRIGLAERQILDAPMVMFLLRNSHLGFTNADTPDSDTPADDPLRPAWAIGLTEDEYFRQARERLLASMPNPDVDEQQEEK